ncbi:hypothetical protein BKA83DRAFT_4131174 [Pisolithus microcarpus]|nr:hypothetical protein BKA83DRAFT_4131174 [Pisolithus microcarpus]
MWWGCCAILGPGWRSSSGMVGNGSGLIGKGLGVSEALESHSSHLEATESHHLCQDVPFMPFHTPAPSRVLGPYTLPPPESLYEICHCNKDSESAKLLINAMIQVEGRPDTVAGSLVQQCCPTAVIHGILRSPSAGPPDYRKFDVMDQHGTHSMSAISTHPVKQ